MTSFPRLRVRLASVALVGVMAVVAGCSSGSGQSFTIEQGAPALTDIEVGNGPEGASHGDILAFEAPISRDGEVVGDMSGMLTTVDIPVDGADGREVLEERIGSIVFRFGDVDTIVVNGSSVYAAGQDEMDPGTPQVRAVLGGTGTYMGVDGQVTTTRNADGTYSHAFELQ